MKALVDVRRRDRLRGDAPAIQRCRRTDRRDHDRIAIRAARRDARSMMANAKCGACGRAFEKGTVICACGRPIGPAATDGVAPAATPQAPSPASTLLHVVGSVGVGLVAGVVLIAVRAVGGFSVPFSSIGTGACVGWALRRPVQPISGAVRGLAAMIAMALAMSPDALAEVVVLHQRATGELPGDLTPALLGGWIGYLTPSVVFGAAMALFVSRPPNTPSGV